MSMINNVLTNRCHNSANHEATLALTVRVLLQACTAWETHAVETQILVIVRRRSVTGTLPLCLLTVLPPQTFLLSPLSLSLSSVHPPPSRHHLCGYTVFSCRTWENSASSPWGCGDRGSLTVSDTCRCSSAVHASSAAANDSYKRVL